MNTKTCNSCKISLRTSNSTKRSIVRAVEITKHNNRLINKERKKEWILKRTPLRNEFLRQCFDDSLAIEKFNCLFVKKEDFDEIVDHSDYDFAKSKAFQTNFIPKEEFEKGYVIDYMMWKIWRKLNQTFII